MKIETYQCDIDKCQNIADNKQKQIQVIFTTEQTEGRSCSPYLALKEIDICTSCLTRVLSGNYIWATGAQGHNVYKFK